MRTIRVCLQSQSWLVNKKYLEVCMGLAWSELFTARLTSWLCTSKKNTEHRAFPFRRVKTHWSAWPDRCGDPHIAPLSLRSGRSTLTPNIEVGGVGELLDEPFLRSLKASVLKWCNISSIHRRSGAIFLPYKEPLKHYISYAIFIPYTELPRRC